jgi:hypothetical protein
MAGQLRCQAGEPVQVCQAKSQLQARRGAYAYTQAYEVAAVVYERCLPRCTLLWYAQRQSRYGVVAERVTPEQSLQRWRQQTPGVMHTRHPCDNGTDASCGHALWCGHLPSHLGRGLSRQYYTFMLSWSDRENSDLSFGQQMQHSATCRNSAESRKQRRRYRTRRRILSRLALRYSCTGWDLSRVPVCLVLSSRPTCCVMHLLRHEG